MKRLVAPAVLAPLSLVVLQAHAENLINSSTNNPQATSTATNGGPDDIHVGTAGSVTPSSGAAITIDSNNTVLNEGVIRIQNSDGAVGILVQPGRTGSITNTGSIQIDDTNGQEDTNRDGLLDAPFTSGKNKYGIRMLGPNPFNGSLTHSGGAITVRGNDSAAISIEGGMTGSLVNNSTTSVIGDRSFALHAIGPIGGDVQISGVVTAQGEGAIAGAFDGSIGGQLYINNIMSSTGYATTTRSAFSVLLDRLIASDLLQGGTTLRVQGSVGGGLLVDSSGAVTSYGSAPAVTLGGNGAMRLRAASSGDDAYGLLNRGSISGQGLYDRFSATALQIAPGGVAIDGGIRNYGQITASAYSADATAITIGAGASVPAIINNATISANVLAPVRGAITGNATAISDASGSVSLVNNVGVIAATTKGTTGTLTALDLSRNTSGVSLIQTGESAYIAGDVLLGSGASRVDMLGGSLIGRLALGGNGSRLTIDNGALVKGAVTSAGTVAVSIPNGSLLLQSADALRLTSLDVGSLGAIRFSADPVSGKASTLNVAGTANLASGARLGIELRSKLTSPATFTAIQANQLNVGTLAPPTFGELSYFYVGSMATSPSAGSITFNVRRRTPAEAGIDVGGGMFDQVFENFDRDPGVRDAFLSVSNQADFSRLYGQMLPDYAGGTFQAFVSGTDIISRAQAQQPLVQGSRTDRIWFQAQGFMDRRGRGTNPGYKVGGVGFVGGMEANDLAIGTLGLSLSYMTAVNREPGAVGGDQVLPSAALGGLYWRTAVGGLQVHAGANAGLAWMHGIRIFDGSDFAGNAVIRTANSHWLGLVAQGHAGAGYQIDIGRVYVRPEITASYLVLKENASTEKGGGESFDIRINSRTSNQGAADAGAVVGYAAQSEFNWRPEFKVAYRTLFGGGADATTSKFLAGGSIITLTPTPLDKGGMVGRFDLRGGNQFSDLGFSVGGEKRGDYRGYDARLTARFFF